MAEASPKMHLSSTGEHIHVGLSSSECKLQRQADRRGSLISGAETAPVSGGGKTDGGVCCQLSILSPSQIRREVHKGKGYMSEYDLWPSLVKISLRMNHPISSSDLMQESRRPVYSHDEENRNDMCVGRKSHILYSFTSVKFYI